MLSPFGYQKILPHATLIFANVVSKSKIDEEFENVLEEYNEKLYKDHSKDRVIHEDNHNKYNSAFENYIKSQIKNVEYVFTMPDLEEEL